jgi:hypothetical protein
VCRGIRMKQETSSRHRQRRDTRKPDSPAPEGPWFLARGGTPLGEGGETPMLKSSARGDRTSAPLGRNIHDESRQPGAERPWLLTCAPPGQDPGATAAEIQTSMEPRPPICQGSSRPEKRASRVRVRLLRLPLRRYAVGEPGYPLHPQARCSFGRPAWSGVRPRRAKAPARQTRPVGLGERPWSAA